MEGSIPQGKAIWDPETVDVFCDLCIIEVEAGRRPGTHLDKVGWENLIRKFNEATKRVYKRQQLKNKWDALKNDWKLWKELIGKETGLGWNIKKNTIDASEEWWHNKLQVYIIIGFVILYSSIGLGRFNFFKCSCRFIPTQRGFALGELNHC